MQPTPGVLTQFSYPCHLNVDPATTHASYACADTSGGYYFVLGIFSIIFCGLLACKGCYEIHKRITNTTALPADENTKLVAIQILNP